MSAWDPEARRADVVILTAIRLEFDAVLKADAGAVPGEGVPEPWTSIDPTLDAPTWGQIIDSLRQRKWPPASGHDVKTARTQP